MSGSETLERGGWGWREGGRAEDVMMTDRKSVTSIVFSVKMRMHR